MKKSIKESKRANTKAGKQACTRLAGQHPNIKEAPENKLFNKQEKKTTKTYLILTAAFVVIFGGVTLMGIFIAHLS